MKVKFLGVGSAFTTADYYQSNMLLTASNGKKMLLDCGTDIRFMLGEEGIDGPGFCEAIDAIYISHLHSDHIGGLEWVAFNTYFSPNATKPKLFAEERLIQELWSNSLKGGLGCVTGKCMELEDYFDCRPLDETVPFAWNDIRFALIRMPHILANCRNHNSYGLILNETENHAESVLITMDTQFCPHLLAPIMEEAVTVFHDCETQHTRSGTHAHYDDLCRLPAVLKQKTWLYHYQPQPARSPQLDGFKGFVRKGQEFEWPAASENN